MGNYQRNFSEVMRVVRELCFGEAYCKVPFHPQQVENLLCVLPFCTSLQHLYLRKAPLAEDAGKLLFSVLAKCHTLETLRLKDCGFSDDDIDMIAAAIISMANLRSVSFGYSLSFGAHEWLCKQCGVEATHDGSDID